MIVLFSVCLAIFCLVAILLLRWALDLRHKLRFSEAKLDRAFAEYELDAWKRDYPELTCRPDRRCDANKQL